MDKTLLYEDGYDTAAARFCEISSNISKLLPSTKAASLLLIESYWIIMEGITQSAKESGTTHTEYIKEETTHEAAERGRVATDQ